LWVSASLLSAGFAPYRSDFRPGDVNLLQRALKISFSLVLGTVLGNTIVHTN